MDYGCWLLERIVNHRNLKSNSRPLDSNLIIITMQLRIMVAVNWHMHITDPSAETHIDIDAISVNASKPH